MCLKSCRLIVTFVSIIAIPAWGQEPDPQGQPGEQVLTRGPHPRGVCGAGRS